MAPGTMHANAASPSVKRDFELLRRVLAARWMDRTDHEGLTSRRLFFAQDKTVKLRGRDREPDPMSTSTPAKLDAGLRGGVTASRVR